jgi:hypothetical protein
MRQASLPRAAERKGSRAPAGHPSPRAQPRADRSAGPPGQRELAWTPSQATFTRTSLLRKTYPLPPASRTPNLHVAQPAAPVAATHDQGQEPKLSLVGRETETTVIVAIVVEVRSCRAGDHDRHHQRVEPDQRHHQADHRRLDRSGNPAEPVRQPGGTTGHAPQSCGIAHPSRARSCPEPCRELGKSNLRQLESPAGTPANRSFDDAVSEEDGKRRLQALVDQLDKEGFTAASTFPNSARPREARRARANLKR